MALNSADCFRKAVGKLLGCFREAVCKLLNLVLDGFNRTPCMLFDSVGQLPHSVDKRRRGVINNLNCILNGLGRRDGSRQSQTLKAVPIPTPKRATCIKAGLTGLQWSAHNRGNRDCPEEGTRRHKFERR